MSKNKHISYQAAAGWMDISVPPDMSEEFRMLVRRATSTWQDMSPEMRDFADRVLGVESIMGQNMKEGHSSNLAMLRGIHWECFWNTGCSNSTRCKQEGACCAKAMFKETNKLCNGHPETCNCPKHCR